MKPGYYWGKLKTLPFEVDWIPVAIMENGTVRIVGNQYDWRLTDFEIGDLIQPNGKTLDEDENENRPSAEEFLELQKENARLKLKIAIEKYSHESTELEKD